MYYEEKVINSIFCYRYGPNDEWTECTKEELTLRLQSAYDDLVKLRNAIELIRIKK